MIKKIQMAIAIMMMRRMLKKDYRSDKDFIQTACKWRHLLICSVTYKGTAHVQSYNPM